MFRDKEIDLGRLDITKMDYTSSSIEMRVLYIFLKNSTKKFISSGSYQVEILNPETGLNMRYYFSLNNTLVKRKRKNIDDDIYEIIDKHRPIGSGKSIVYLSYGSLTLNHVSSSLTYKARKKAVKKVQKREAEKDKLLQEYFLTDLVRYMQTKEPVLIETNVFNEPWLNSKAYDMYMVMRYIEGLTLASLFAISMSEKLYLSEEKSKKYFNADELIIITINLLNCMDSVNENNIGIFDFHSGNIMVEPETLDAFLIDFGEFYRIPPGSVKEERRSNAEHLLTYIINLWDVNYNRENQEERYTHLINYGFNEEHIEQLQYMFRYKENKSNDLIKDLLALMYKIKDERLLSTIPESVRGDIKYALDVSREVKNKIKNMVNSTSLNFIEQTALILYYASKIPNKELCLEVFISELGITYLKGCKSKDDLIKKLTELNECYNRINVKVVLLSNLKDSLDNWKKLQTKKSDDPYIIYGIENYIKYINYLLHKKTKDTGIYHDIFKTENKIDNLILSISRDIDLNTINLNALFSIEVLASENFKNNDISYLELTLLKMKLKLAIDLYRAEHSNFMHSWRKARALSKRRQADMKDLLQIIYAADSKDDLIAKLKARSELIERGILGKSELAECIESVISTEPGKIKSPRELI